jgi:hypothetical protein
MIKAACHCTAIRFAIARAPKWVVDCNCTLCRRYGALWAYCKTGDVVFVAGEGDTDAYEWGAGKFAFHRCKHCGCLTHHTALDVDPPRIRAVNARIIPTLDPTRVNLQHTDNGHTGFFWTRAPDKFEPGGEPTMAPPGSYDWR